MVDGASQALGIASMMQDMGFEGIKVGLGTDSAAAKGIASRKGLGKVRHIEVCQLWLQEKVPEGRIGLIKVKGTENPADIRTMHVTSE
eukprot:14359551-Alexandrium_andersonii.AAC.1